MFANLGYTSQTKKPKGENKQVRDKTSKNRCVLLCTVFQSESTNKIVCVNIVKGISRSNCP